MMILIMIFIMILEGCSRLSPHLAFGTVSMREVFQCAEARRAEVKGVPERKERPSPLHFNMTRS